MQRFSEGRTYPATRWRPPRWIGLVGIAWIVTLVTIYLVSQPLSLRGAGYSLLGVVGIVHLWAYWRATEGEWERNLKRLYRGGTVALVMVLVVSMRWA